MSILLVLSCKISRNRKECWIVDVKNRRLEVHKNPKVGVYALVETFLSDEEVTLTEWDITISVTSLLGKLG